MTGIPGMCIIVFTGGGISSDSPRRWMKSPTCVRWIPTSGSSTVDSHQVNQRRSWQALRVVRVRSTGQVRHSRQMDWRHSVRLEWRKGRWLT